MTEWQSAEGGGRERIDRARQAAEDLFKPTQQSTGGDPALETPDAASTAERQPKRQPRIFAVPARTPMSAEAETPIEPKRIRPKPIRRENGSVAPSQLGRVRALTSYGMTQAQVAELYGVTVEEIERIIR